MPTNRGLSKTGLIRALAARLDISLKESGALVDAFLETMTEADSRDARREARAQSEDRRRGGGSPAPGRDVPHGLRPQGVAQQVVSAWCPPPLRMRRGLFCAQRGPKSPRDVCHIL